MPIRIAATVQARMGSSRLPGKVLKTIVGKPMLALQVERIQRSLLIDKVIIATSTEKQDDVIERLASDIGVQCFRGSENDVLSRIVGALKAFEVDINVEFMGDNPMPDPMLVDSVIGFYLKHADRYDFVTNSLKTTYPPGAEVSVHPSQVLYDADNLTVDSPERQHVSIHIWQRPERFRICNLEAPAWFHYPKLFLEVDTETDFEVVSAIYEHFYPENPGFGLAQVIDFMNANPGLASRNSQVERRWKAYRQD